MIRAVRLVAALAIALGSLAPARSAAAAPEIETVPAAITRLLADYGKAFARHDRSLLVSTLAPDMRTREAAALANAKDVPFSVFAVKATTLYSGDLASARIRNRYPGSQVRTYHVEIETAVDVEANPYLEDGAFTVARKRAGAADRYQGWRIVSKRDMDPLAFFSPHFLWDEAKVSVLRSKHFILLTHPSVTKEIEPVLAVAERAYIRATSFWTGPGPRDQRFAIIVPSSTGELDRILESPIDLSKFVAFVAAGVSRDDGWEPAGPRLFVHLDHFRRYDDDARVEIVAHELIHAITRDESGPHVPLWVEEGLANAGGGNGGRARVTGGPRSGDFPSDDEFDVGPVRDIQRAYDRGQLAIETLIAAKGKPALVAFYDALGAERVVPGDDDYYVDRAIETARWTKAEWLDAWHAKLR